jgi:WD40 repeat protein
MISLDPTFKQGSVLLSKAASLVLLAGLVLGSCGAGEESASLGSGWSYYKSPNLGLSLELPRKWVLDVDSIGNPVRRWYCPESGLNVSTYLNARNMEIATTQCMMWEEASAMGADLSSFAETEAGVLGNSPGFEFLAEGELDVSGHSAYWIAYKRIFSVALSDVFSVVVRCHIPTSENSFTVVEYRSIEGSFRYEWMFHIQDSLGSISVIGSNGGKVSSRGRVWGTEDTLSPLVFNPVDFRRRVEEKQLGLKVIQAHASGNLCMDISNDGSKCATGGSDGYVHIWDTSTWERIATLDPDPLEYEPRIKGLDFAPDGETVYVAQASGGYISARSWNWQTDQPPVYFAEQVFGNVAVLCQPSGKFVVAVGDDAVVWNTEAEEELRRIEPRVSYMAACISPDGSTVLLGDLWGGIELLNLRTWRRSKLSRDNGPVLNEHAWQATFSSDGSLGAVLTARAVYFWSFPSGSFERRLGTRCINSVSILPGGEHILTAEGRSDSRSCRDSVRIREVEDGEIAWEYLGFDEKVQEVLVIPGSNRIVAVSGDGRLRSLLVTGQAAELLTGKASVESRTQDE